MMNYAWDFSQSDTEKYLECIITYLMECDATGIPEIYGHLGS